MANHVRQQLREAIATAVTGLTTTSTRVFQNRVYQISQTELPCLMVMTDGDRVENLTVHAPYQQQRETQVRIEAIAMATDDLDDTLDTICKEVEIAIANSASSLVNGMSLKGTRIDFEAIGEQPTGKATMIFSQDLYTLSNAPDVVL